MSEALVESRLSHDEARSLTDEVRNDAEQLWRKLVGLYEGRAHEALGYGSWHAYFEAEFGGSRRAAYRLLDAARVARALDECPPGTPPIPTEKHARMLAPLKNDPELVREAWTEVTETYEKPTSADVREVVEQKVGPMSRKAEMNSGAAKRRVYDGLSSVSGYATALSDSGQYERALSTATPEDIAAWDRLASESIRALSSLRRAIREAK